MILTASSRVCGNAFLREVIVSPVEMGELVEPVTDDVLATAINACLCSGRPLVACQPSSASCSAVACLPIFQSAELRAIVTLVARRSAKSPAGVIEIWSPVAQFQELALCDGYFADLDRFQNVSSFVRFEKGAGLPGQVWEQGCAIIQDDLGRHPGFVRAAGASADELQTAVGIPVFSDTFIASAVLISSRSMPLARAIEIWKPTENEEFVLSSGAYCSVPEELRLLPGSKIPRETGLVGLAAQLGSAAASEDVDLLHAGRNVQDTREQFTAGVALPTYVGGHLASITLLVL